MMPPCINTMSATAIVAEICSSFYETKRRKVREIPLQEDYAGQFSVAWNGRSSEGAQVPSGVYFYQLVHADGASEARRMIVLR